VTVYRIERGAPTQAPRLQQIELAAGTRFRDIGMADVAEGEPTPNAILEDRAAAGQLYVAVDDEGAIAGFLIWSEKDGLAYIEEVSVHPHHARHRLAARMIDRLADDIRNRLPALSLATFRDVPWNAPYYARLGFVELPQHKVGPQHAQSWGHQAANGLDMSRRIFMTRPVPA
jgi:ribosomal protein S18 acetylase RimI-like enzyme